MGQVKSSQIVPLPPYLARNIKEFIYIRVNNPTLNNNIGKFKKFQNLVNRKEGNITWSFNNNNNNNLPQAGNNPIRQAGAPLPPGKAVTPPGKTSPSSSGWGRSKSPPIRLSSLLSGHCSPSLSGS